MIDTNELRSMVNGAQFEGFANSVIHSLLDRLEGAEKERDALRVKIEAMEQQNIAIMDDGTPPLRTAHSCRTSLGLFCALESVTSTYTHGGILTPLSG